MSQFEMRVVEGRLLFEGVEVEDVLDNQAHLYTQSDHLSQQQSMTLAFRAGQIAEHAQMQATGARLIPVSQQVD